MKTKRILIPTDFTVSSLNILKTVLSNNHQKQKYDIVLVHGLHVSDSITDMLFYSKSGELRKLAGSEFREALMILKNKYQSDINTISEELFTGQTQRAFDNFIEANKIEEVYLPDNYHSAQLSYRSFSLLPYITNSTIKVNGGERAAQQPMPEKGQVAEILLNTVTSG